MFSKLFSKPADPQVEWHQLNNLSQLAEIEERSKERPVLIFKHSTRCSISAMALGKFERNFDSEAKFDPYFLDLIAHREVSNEIASRYHVVHESPQALLIVDGKVIYHASHNGINFQEINNQVQ